MTQESETAVRVGSAAPSLRLRNHAGAWADLTDYRGRCAVVVYFYPKAGTAGCTAEACAFRDEYEVFRERGAEVIGVSSDSVEALAEFSTRNRLPFVLVSDAGGEVRREWGVPKDLWLLPGRVTYIIDKDGVVRGLFRSAVNMRRHVEEAVRLLGSLDSGT